MRTAPSIVLLLVALATVGSLQAQEHHGGPHQEMMAHHPPVVPDLLEAVSTVREKLVGLAQAMPEERYGWRPSPGTRSVSEVLMHIAADNYFLPTGAGVEAPASTGIQGDSYESVRGFEGREVTKTDAIQQLEASFDHLVEAMGSAPQESMGEELMIFELELTGQRLWLLATTHLHEHLGQMIAYARSNDIVPPWSR